MALKKTVNVEMVLWNGFGIVYAMLGPNGKGVEFLVSMVTALGPSKIWILTLQYSLQCPKDKQHW